MSYTKLTLVLLLSLFAFPTILAQESSEDAVKDEITEMQVELSSETQDPVSKNVKFNLTLNSNIDSDRVKITWTSTGPNNYTAGQNYLVNGFDASGEIRIKKGQTYSVPINITIYGFGVNELIGKVEIVLPEGTKVLTVRTNFGSNAEGEVLPLTEEYTQAKNLNNIKNIVTWIIGIILTLIIGFFALKKFLKWLDQGDRETVIT